MLRDKIEKKSQLEKEEKKSSQLSKVVKLAIQVTSLWWLHKK